MAIFAVRLSRERRDISQVEIMGKFAGAVGNYSAHLAAYPAADWPRIAEEFVTSLGLSFNQYVSQVCPCVLLFYRVKLHIVCFKYDLSNYSCDIVWKIT